MPHMSTESGLPFPLKLGGEVDTAGSSARALEQFGSPSFSIVFVQLLELVKSV